MFATTLLHAIATTLFGICLGFGAYTFLTHWLAIAIGPVALLRAGPEWSSIGDDSSGGSIEESFDVSSRGRTSSSGSAS